MSQPIFTGVLLPRVPDAAVGRDPKHLETAILIATDDEAYEFVVVGVEFLPVSQPIFTGRLLPRVPDGVVCGADAENFQRTVEISRGSKAAQLVILIVEFFPRPIPTVAVARYLLRRVPNAVVFGRDAEELEPSICIADSRQTNSVFTGFV